MRWSMWAPDRSNSVLCTCTTSGTPLSPATARPAGNVIQSWAWTTSNVSFRANSADRAAYRCTSANRSPAYGDGLPDVAADDEVVVSARKPRVGMLARAASAGDGIDDAAADAAGGFDCGGGGGRATCVGP